MNTFDFSTYALIILFAPLVGFFFTVILGKKFSKMYLFEVAIITVVLLTSIFIAYMKLGHYRIDKFIYEFEWINLGIVPGFGEINMKLGIIIDNISVIMMFVVALVSALVHYFSIEYMKGDVRYNRYFAYLGIFTFSMMGIVLTHNLLMMYIFWELVGLSSYLLIGHWYEKKSASDAAKKAFIVNRIGDIGMLLGILIIYNHYHTFVLDEIFSAIASGKLPFDSAWGLTVTGLLLFCGAVGKSAQFPLHVWLPDAMEGPTPVSALIHAATMVAAGVYLVVRIFPMLTGDALFVIACIGALSAFIPATIALTQTDIKKVLAYSTISQLGYMILALGVGAYSLAFFHLVTHAFFKAGLFLGSGSVIHSMHHEQEITNMGGLRKKMPITYVTFLIFSLAISGIPLTSGFLSKDGILAATFAFGLMEHNWIFAIVGFTVALMTAFYMFRLLILTFHGEPRDHHKFEHAHESPKLMTFPLILLAVLSFFIFYTTNPLNAESGWVLSEWIERPESVVPEDARYFFLIDGMDYGTPEETLNPLSYEALHDAMHAAHFPAMILSLILALTGMLVAYIIYEKKKLDTDAFVKKISPLYKFSLNKWYFDEFYDKAFVQVTILKSKLLAWFDAKVIDGIVNGSASITRLISRFSGGFDNVVVDGAVNLSATLSGLLGIILRKFQTGKVQTYLVMVVFSLVILILIFSGF